MTSNSPLINVFFLLSQQISVLKLCSRIENHVSSNCLLFQLLAHFRHHVTSHHMAVHGGNHFAASLCWATFAKWRLNMELSDGGRVGGGDTLVCICHCNFHHPQFGFLFSIGFEVSHLRCCC